MARRRNKSEERDIAVRRIDTLLAQARLELLRRQAAPLAARATDLPGRYGMLALRVAEKFQTGLSAAQKAQLCRKCGAFRSLSNSRTRLRAGRITVACLLCGHVARRPLGSRPAAIPNSVQA